MVPLVPDIRQVATSNSVGPGDGPRVLSFEPFFALAPPNSEEAPALGTINSSLIV